MQKIYEDVKKVFESKILVRVLYAVGIIIVALLIFSAGVAVGFHKASFGRAWGERYMQNFGRMSAPQGFGDGEHFRSPHGAVGKIIKIELPNIIVQDKDGTEKVIATSADTSIQKTGTVVTANDLQVDDFVVVIGAPNDTGVIEAKFIRIIPSPEFLK